MVPFHRRYVLIPVLAGIALVMVAFFAVEIGRSQLVSSVHAIQRSEERSLVLLEVQSLITDAETGQRGYVLTGDESYLAPYEQARKQAAGILTSLNAAYSGAELAELQPQATQVVQLAAAKLSELDSTVTLYRRDAQGPAQALALMRTNIGLATMSSLRNTIIKMRTQESAFIQRQETEWQQTQTINRAISIAGALLNIGLIVLAGYLVNKTLLRRTAITTDLETRVNKHTNDLSELSTHLQRVSEAEKSSLARELHDELGGLLVGIKMDLAQLRSKLDLEQPDVKKRWDRIQGLLTTGIELKRRVIEQLRPSLLDNMGIVSAVHWQVGEICGAAGLELIERYPEEEPDLNGEAAIAIFRIAQESLNNIVKHAHATRVSVEIKIVDDKFMMTIEDNGVGLPIERSVAAGSHGITGMRHRLLSFDGVFAIESAEPKGARLRFTLPMSRVANLAEHAA